MTRPLPWPARRLADIDFLDLYSCFASNVNFTRDVLGIADDDPRPLTVTGGLPYFGGPGNNYTTHSIAAMVELLRDNRGSSGLVTGVGMHMTNHSFAIYSSAPRDIKPIAPGRLEFATRKIADQVNGPATLVGYTVLHSKTDRSVAAVCELEDGSRCYARCNDPALVDAMDRDEWVGRGVQLRSTNGVNSIYQ